MGSDFDSFNESPLGAFSESALHERGLVLAAQKHIGTAADEHGGPTGTPMLVDADSSGIYFYMGHVATGTEYEVAFLSADGETLNNVRKITPGFQAPLAFVATSSYVFLFGRAAVTLNFALWRMTKGSFDIPYREYSTPVGLPVCAVRVSDSQIVMALSDRLLWLNEGLSVDTVNAYSGGGALDLVSDGADLFIGGIRTGDRSFYAKIDSSKNVVFSREIILAFSLGTDFAMDVSGSKLVYVRGVKDLVCIDHTTHSVVWAKRITTGYLIHDVLINEAEVICVGEGHNGMFVMLLDLSTGSLNKKNRLNTLGRLTHITRSSGAIYIAGFQYTQSFGFGDGQLFLRPTKFSDVPIHQVSTVTIGVFDAATTYNVTIGGVTISQVGVTDRNTTVALLAAALAASVDPNFDPITWTSATNVITGTADVGDTPFTITVSKTGGTGTITTQVTMSVVTMIDVSPTVSSFTITKSAGGATVHDTIDSTSATAAHEMDDTTFVL